MQRGRRFLKVCITGGPSAGKTTVIDLLKREFSTHAHCLPEAASILYRGGFPRSNDPESIRSAQRAIYYTQVEMERIYEAQCQAALLICDRGTLDHPAYWPEDSSNPTLTFFNSVGSDPEHEAERYDLVIHLHTSSFEYGQDAIRIESLDEAMVLDGKIERSWRVHPQRVLIPSQMNFRDKINKVIETLDVYLGKNSPFREINSINDSAQNRSEFHIQRELEIYESL